MAACPKTAVRPSPGRARTLDLPIAMESDVRRQPGWLQTDRACSRWMPRRSRRIQNDRLDDQWMIKAHPIERRMLSEVESRWEADRVALPTRGGGMGRSSAKEPGAETLAIICW